LLSQYVTWQGVPYRNGGRSRKGIDCSAFVQLTYQQKFGVKLPRTTREQATQGGLITNSGLRPGDLILFKTGWNERHIGIYLEKYKFMHVSTSIGVTISTITDPYWYERYWQARRVFN
jgi:cell wall-associated NlpC family hydrolase